jgi:hypothetical protein
LVFVINKINYNTNNTNFLILKPLVMKRNRNLGFCYYNLYNNLRLKILKYIINLTNNYMIRNWENPRGFSICNPKILLEVF